MAIGTLAFAHIEGRTLGWWKFDAENLPVIDTWPLDLSPIPLPFAVSLLAVASFVRWERRRRHTGAPTLLDLSLFAIPSIRYSKFAAMVVSLGEFGIVLSLPVWLQNVLGYDALRTGLVLLALAIGSFLASGITGAFGRSVRALTIVRTGILAAMIGGLRPGHVVRPDASWPSVIPLLAVYDFGVGLAIAQLTGVVLKDVPVARSGQASGTQSTSRRIGSALGIAVFGAVLFTSTGHALDRELAVNAPHLPMEVRGRNIDSVVVRSGAAIPDLR